MWTSLTQIPSSVRITSYRDAYFQGCSTNNYDNTTHDRGLKDSMTVHRTISSCQEHTEYPRKYLTSMEGKTTTYAGKNFVIGMVSEVGERSWQDKELMMWWHISTYIYTYLYLFLCQLEWWFAIMDHDLWLANCQMIWGTRGPCGHADVVAWCRMDLLNVRVLALGRIIRVTCMCQADKTEKPKF